MKALVIDDHPSIVEMLSKSLSSEKFIVDKASDGDEGFQKAKSRAYDIILLDIMLPGKNGFEIISGLRALGINTPILVISARGMVEDKIRGLDLGADDYLVKGNYPVQKKSKKDLTGFCDKNGTHGCKLNHV